MAAPFSDGRISYAIFALLISLLAPQQVDAGAMQELLKLEPELEEYRQVQADVLAAASQGDCTRADTSTPKKTIKLCSSEIEPLSALLKSNQDLLKRVAAVGKAAKSEKPGKDVGKKIKAAVQELKDGRRLLAGELSARLAVRSMAAFSLDKKTEARKGCERARKLAETSGDTTAREMAVACEARLAAQK